MSNQHPSASILIVDDTLVNLHLLSQMLSKHGYKVRAVNSGARALESVKANPPDLILLDIMMPEMNGYEVCKYLKADEQTCDIPVIFISALDAMEDKVNAFSAGGVDYVTKPLQVEEVLARVETHLTLQNSQKRLEEQNAQLGREIAERKRAEEMSRTLFDTAQALSTTLRLDRLLERVLDELQRVVPYDAASISMLHDEYCGVIASRGQERAALRRFALKDRPLVQQVVRERRSLISSPGVEGTEGGGSWLGVPLIAKDRVLGVLMMDSYASDVYDEGTAQLAFAFAHQVALALDNSLLYEQVQAKLYEADLIHSVTMALSSTLDLDQILPYVARSLCEMLGGTSVEIYNLDEKTDTITVIAGYTASGKERRSELDRSYALAAFPAVAEALAQRCPIQARADNPEADPHLQASLQARGAQAMLLLPMVTSNRRVGLVWVWDDRHPRRFDEGEIATGQTLVHQAAIAIDNARLVEALREYTAELEREKQKSDRLLLNILPARVANDLKETGQTTPRTFEHVTVYFSDIVGFTAISSQLEPGFLIDELNELFTAFDIIMEKNHCERIKTVGDAYLAVCGMPEENESHAANIVQSAIEVVDYLQARNERAEIKWHIRIGIHSGKVVGGVVGVKKYIYDVFGDTINTSQRMESLSEPMKINVSESTYDIVKDEFHFVERGAIEVKGKGRMLMYFVDGGEL